MQLSTEAQQIVAAFVHTPCDRHDRVLAPDRVWDELRLAFPPKLIPDEEPEDGYTGPEPTVYRARAEE